MISKPKAMEKVMISKVSFCFLIFLVVACLRTNNHLLEGEGYKYWYFFKSSNGLSSGTITMFYYFDSDSMFYSGSINNNKPIALTKSRWRIKDSLIIFLQAPYDFTAPDNLRIIKLSKDTLLVQHEGNVLSLYTSPNRTNAPLGKPKLIKRGGDM